MDWCLPSCKECRSGYVYVASNAAVTPYQAPGLPALDVCAEIVLITLLLQNGNEPRRCAWLFNTHGKPL